MNIYPEFTSQYNEYVSHGSAYLHNKKICITGLIKNGEHFLEDKLLFFNLFKTYCQSLDIVIYENDSIDNTANILRSWSSDDIDFHIISEKLNATHRGSPHKDTERTMAMAYYRSKCQEYIRTNINVDYIIVIDLDYKNISLDGLLNSFGWIAMRPQINMMAGFSYQQHNNGLLTNYDSWAYRGNWWNDYQADRNFAYSFINWRPFVGSSPFEVNSAFGGSCIYKSNVYLLGQYEGHDCEHVTFHRSIYNSLTDGYNLYANPSQIMVV